MIKQALASAFAYMAFFVSATVPISAQPLNSETGSTVQSTLPRCQTGGWDNCFGKSGAYTGEWRNNKRHGIGTFTFETGTVYRGEFQNGAITGRGTFFFANGSKYEGSVKDGEPDGEGTWMALGGEKYVGEWLNGKRHGYGTWTHPLGAEYQGDWREGKRSGFGIYKSPVMSHIGMWEDGDKNGQGTEFELGGSVVLNGVWARGRFIKHNDFPTPSRTSSVKLIKELGVFKIPVEINGVLKLHFTVDSGATDVILPSDVVLTLIRTGTVQESDFIGEQTYRLADGSTIKSKVFTIRQLRVGSHTILNVTASVTKLEGGLLLGQSFLSRFKSIKFDYAQEVLVLD